MSDFIPWAKPDFWGNEERYVIDALKSTWISGGPFVDKLERDFAVHQGAAHALTASNGTTAIHMAYLGIGLQAGDEVIVPGFGFQAAANVAIHMNLKPVFAEVDPQTWCLTAEAMERCISGRTKAVVPVHTYGNVCDMDSINAVAALHGIHVIEDAAEAFCSRYKGHFAGTMSLVGTYSFQATKTITTGEGGMVVTQRKDLFERMGLYRSHGMLKRRYWHELPGHNFRLTNMQAALGCAQFEHLERIIAERRRVHSQYVSNLTDFSAFALQLYKPEVDAVLWAIAVKLDPKAYPQGRDQVMDQMKSQGIETRPGFYAASQLPLYGCKPLPQCEEVSSQVISLPTFPSLTNEQIARITSTLKQLRR